MQFPSYWAPKHSVVGLVPVNPTPFYIEDILERNTIGSLLSAPILTFLPPLLPLSYTGGFYPGICPGYPGLATHLRGTPLLSDSPAPGGLPHQFYRPLEKGKEYFWNPFALCRSYKRKGGQVRFTNNQTLELEKKFENQKYLHPPERKRLAGILQLSERQVKTWFQNRRAKWRRMKQELTGFEKPNWLASSKEDQRQEDTNVRPHQVNEHSPPRSPTESDPPSPEADTDVEVDVDCDEDGDFNCASPKDTASNK